MKPGSLYFRRQRNKELVFRVERDERRKRITLKPLAQLVGDDIIWVGVAKKVTEEARKDLSNQIVVERKRQNTVPDSLENRILDIFGSHAEELKNLVKAIQTEEERDLILMGLLDAKSIIADEMSKKA